MNIAPAQHRVTDPSALKRHPVLAYFAFTFAISWTGALLVIAPSLARGTAIPKMAGVLMFPAMLLGPSLSAFVLTCLLEGQSGLKDLLSRMRRVRLPVRWYAVLLIPPAVVLTVLYGMAIFGGDAFTPNRFYVGAVFGVVAGFFEEIGWMGFAFPHMRAGRSAISSALVLGVLWSLWHLPVIDYLGAATPHGDYWLRYFFAFAAVMIPMRVLIGWFYTNTRSVPACQLLHASSTGSLVVFSPATITAAQEASWYFVYAGAVWIIVVVVVAACGRNLSQRPEDSMGDGLENPAPVNYRSAATSMRV